jgi:hypothetical protein
MKRIIVLMVALSAVTFNSNAQSDLMTAEHKAQLELEKRIKDEKAQGAAPDSISPWKAGFTPTINFSQVSLSNWSGGGQNAMSFTGLFSGFLNYQKNKWTWYNNLDLGYGLTRIGDNSDWIKSEDKIIYVEKLSYKLGKHVKASWFNDFRTQFADGRRYYKSETTGLDTSDFVSTFLAPAYWTSAVGIEYMPSEHFFLFYAPVAHKMTIVNDTYLSALGSYGVTPGNTIRSEIGTMLNAKLKVNLMENITFSSGLTLFGNYQTLDRIDMFWDNTLLMKVNKLITVSFTTNMIYDDDIKLTRGDGTVGPDLQYKHVLSVGISARIGDQQ